VSPLVFLKVIRRRQQRSIDSKGILKQSESEEAPNRQEATGSNSIQVSSAILQNQVTSFIIYFTSLILTDFFYKITEPLAIVFDVQFKNQKTKKAVDNSPFLKKIANYQWVCERKGKTNTGRSLSNCA
jgi:hypothetical protein